MYSHGWLHAWFAPLQQVVETNLACIFPGSFYCLVVWITFWTSLAGSWSSLGFARHPLACPHGVGRSSAGTTSILELNKNTKTLCPILRGEKMIQGTTCSLLHLVGLVLREPLIFLDLHLVDSMLWPTNWEFNSQASSLSLAQWPCLYKAMAQTALFLQPVW